jgi:hypothetical protein
MKLISILIPWTTDRLNVYNRLVSVLNKQINDLNASDVVSIIDLCDNYELTTGAKRNLLIQMAIDKRSEYIAFFDSDDLPSANYIQKQLEVANSGLDCGSLKGQIYWSGVPGKPFLHFLECKQWWEDTQYYYRCPNHLNAIKLSLIKDIKFKDINFGEDGNWSEEIMRLGILKTEYQTNDILYHYFCGTKNTPIETEILNQL